MLYFTRNKLAYKDKTITRLLRNSNFYANNKDKDISTIYTSDIDFEEQWIKEVENFIEIVLNEKAYKSFIESKNLTKQDLVLFYILMTVATLPNPIFKTGPKRLSHTLTGSAMYQEVKKQLTICIYSLGRFDNKEDKNRYGHQYASDVMSFASALKFQHEHAYGPITLEEALFP